MSKNDREGIFRPLFITFSLEARICEVQIDLKLYFLQIVRNHFENLCWEKLIFQPIFITYQSNIGVVGRAQGFPCLFLFLFPLFISLVSQCPNSSAYCRISAYF